MTMIDETQETRLRLIHRRAREYLRDIAGGLFLAAERFCILTSSENDGVALWWPRADIEAFEGRMKQMVDYVLRHRQPAYWAAGGYLADGGRDMSEVGERSRADRLEALAKGMWVTPKLAAEYRGQQEGSGEAAEPKAEWVPRVGDRVAYGNGHRDHFPNPALGVVTEVGPNTAGEPCCMVRFDHDGRVRGWYRRDELTLESPASAPAQSQPSAEPQAAELPRKDPYQEHNERLVARLVSAAQFTAGKTVDQIVAASMLVEDHTEDKSARVQGGDWRSARTVLEDGLRGEQQPRRVVAHPHEGRSERALPRSNGR